MARTVRMLPAKCALDLGDGSERGEYVDQDYILNRLGRPHRAVNIMYTYYPNDSQWPARISEACRDMDVGFVWDYPYDDYYPFCEGGKQFEQMRDIRRHGQDVMLTITCDCSIEDDRIRNIAASLKPYGRIMLRINHECNGNWFTHNKRFSYEEIAAFFVRFSRIVREEAPNVRMVFCAGLVGEEGSGDDTDRVELEDVFADAYRVADIWSADKYLALHYGWPYDIAEAGGGSYSRDDPRVVFERYQKTYKRLSGLYGDRPFIQAELNADGDVMGPLHQSELVMEYYGYVKDTKASWLTGISMYQFRDRGRLGLEREDQNNPSVGIEQPLMEEYKKVLSDPWFTPEFETGDEILFPARLRWGGSEDAEGIELEIYLEGVPEFCEITCQEDLSLMVEFCGKWFYKGPGVGTIDLMSAFFANRSQGPATVPLRIFATPPDGMNHDDGTGAWMTDQFYQMSEEPKLRIRYEIPGFTIVRDGKPVLE